MGYLPPAARLTLAWLLTSGLSACAPSTGPAVASRSPAPARATQHARGSLAASRTQVCAVRRGDVWCWGSYVDDFREGYVIDRRGPTRFSIPGVAVEVALTELHTCARNDAGRIYCWGANTHGERGRPPSLEIAHDPQAVDLPCAATQLVAEEGATYVLCESGAVLVVGDCGEADPSCRVVRPLLAEDGAPLTNIARISRRAAITRTGELWRWGGDGSGQISRRLAAPNRRGAGGEPRVPDVVVSASHRVPGLSGVREAGDPRDATCVSMDDGRVRCWGHNGLGELGVPTRPWSQDEDIAERRRAARYRSVELSFPSGLGRARRLWCRYEMCCAEEEDRTIVCWGHNQGGRIRPGAGPIVLPVRMRFPTIRELAIGVSFVCIEADAVDHEVSCVGALPLLDSDPSIVLHSPRSAPERVELPPD